MGGKACHRISAFSSNLSHTQVNISGLSHSHVDYSVPIKNLMPKSLKFLLSFSFLPPPLPATIGHLSKAKWAQNAILNVGRTHYLMCPENKQGRTWVVSCRNDQLQTHFLVLIAFSTADARPTGAQLFQLDSEKAVLCRWAHQVHESLTVLHKATCTPPPKLFRTSNVCKPSEFPVKN